MEGNESKKIYHSLFWVYLENISSQIVTFVVTIILARLLCPDDYGTIALITVFVNVANVFVNSSFSYALIQKKDADDLDYQSIFWFNIVLSALLYIVLFASAPYIANYYEMPILTDVLRVLSLKIIVSSYNSVQLAKVSHDLNFKKSFMSTSAGTLISGFIGVLLAYSGFGVWALVNQSLFSTVLNTLFLCVIVRWTPKLCFSFERLLPLLKFGWNLLATGLMFTLFSELNKLIIGKRYSAEDLGLYDRGSAFPRIIASNIDTTITRVLFPVLSNKQDNICELSAMIRLSAQTSAFIMTPILFIMAVLAHPIVHVVLTEKWILCVPYFQMMCLSWWMQPTQSCSIQGIKAIGRSDVYLRIEVLSKVVGLILLIGAVVIFDSVFFVALSLVISQAVSMLIYGYYTQKLLKYRIEEQIKDIFIPAIIGMIVCLPVYLMSSLCDYSFFSIIINSCICLGLYVFVSHICKVNIYIYIYNSIKKIVKK